MKARAILAAGAMALLVPGHGLAQAVVAVTLERDGDFVTAPAADDYAVESAGAAVPVLLAGLPGIRCG
jgi:hypothetical protein